MRTTPKYKSKVVFFDTDKQIVIDSSEVERYRNKARLRLPENITRFDSQHEFKVYLELCRIYGADRIVRQYPIELIPPGQCYPKGKTWKVDFAIKDADKREALTTLVEAKGALMPEFISTLAHLEVNEPDAFEDLVVVFSRSIPTDNKVIKSLLNKTYAPQFYTLKELEQSTHEISHL
ncbi:hypothetical protein C7B62_06635 [Pleurocapsa sp. CCALA 161]|uniref:hypothetical protein n=1 Tax=Pleurocapsa sp. CCALA 161 TaxID=2107688 RepID=UPI000D071A92|nr:hypothetical protein [Pleurocapsa sp. CCALA 161]PSB11101.1 hypothetical protein C7B62_06635 [Pleurocapsa sp. CCALA 161]